jgi:hypothetical protein
MPAFSPPPTSTTGDATGTGSLVRATSPTLVTPVLGVATATSLAIGGATIGTDALAVTGTATFSSSISMGGNAVVSGGNVFIGAGLQISRNAAATLQLGAADAAAPVAQTLTVQSVVAGTTNTAGTNFTIAGSKGTGTGAGGSIIFQVAPAGLTGSAQNALSTALTIDSTRLATFTGDVFLNAASGTIYLGSAGDVTMRRAASGSLRIGDGAAFTNNVTLTVGAANLLTLNGGLTTAGSITTGINSTIGWAASSYIWGQTDGIIRLTNNANTDFSRLQFGGTTSSFPAFRRSATALEVVLADASNFAPLRSSTYEATTTVRAGYNTAIPAGGSADVAVTATSTANFGVFFGSGAPTLSAAKGSLYMRSDGSGVNDRMYVNTDGSTTWTAVVTVA